MENQNNMNNGAMLAALGYPVALPQTVEQYPTYKHSVQRTQYDPNKMRALVEALRTPQQMEKGKWELLGNALAKNITSPQYEGAYGVKFGDYRTNALAQGANMFNDIYGAQKQQERDAANAARENEIKALQMELDAGKQVISDENGMQWIKFNDPNAKAYTEMREEAKNANVLNMLENNLEDIGKRFDEDFKDIDDMQANSTRLGRASIGGLYGAGVSKEEKLARDEFEAWKGSMKNVLVNANRQAGSGSMSDADAARYEQNIGQSKTPAEARVILRSFTDRMNAGKGQVQAPLSNDINAIWDMIK